MHDLYKGGDVLFYELGDRVAELLEGYGLRVRDLGRINEMIRGVVDDNRVHDSCKEALCTSRTTSTSRL